MKFKEFKKRVFQSESGHVIIELDSLEKYHPDNNKLIKLFRDNRSYQEGGVWYVYPIALTNSQVFVVCPYCGEIHAHGNSNGYYEGSRVPHCNNPGKGDYFIQKFSRGEDQEDDGDQKIAE